MTAWRIEDPTIGDTTVKSGAGMNFTVVLHTVCVGTLDRTYQAIPTEWPRRWARVLRYERGRMGWR